MTLLGILKWFMISADRLGVGLKSEQLTITHPTWRGVTPAFASTSRTAAKHTCTAHSSEPLVVKTPKSSDTLDSQLLKLAATQTVLCQSANCCIAHIEHAHIEHRHCNC